MTRSSARLPDDARLARLCFLVLPFLSALMWIGESRSNTYAIGEYFLTYRHGFLKRALLGELLSHFGVLSLNTIQAVEILSVFLAVALSYFVFWRALTSASNYALIAVIFLCSSACLPHLSLLAAQPDTLLYVCLLLAYLCLVRLPSLWAPIAAVVPCVVALLLHEAFLLLFYPALLAIFADGYRNRRFKLVGLVVHFLCVGAAFLWITRHGALHLDPAAMVDEAQQRASFPIDGAIFYVLRQSLMDQVRGIRMFYTPAFFAGLFANAIFFLPAIAGQAALVRTVNGSRSRPIPLSILAVAVCAPLALCFLGHDVFRWVAGSAISLTLFLMYLLDSHETEVDASVASLPRSGLYALLLYGFAIGPLGAGSIRIVTRLATMLGKG